MLYDGFEAEVLGTGRSGLIEGKESGVGDIGPNNLDRLNQKVER